MLASLLACSCSGEDSLCLIQPQPQQDGQKLIENLKARLKSEKGKIWPSRLEFET